MAVVKPVLKQWRTGQGECNKIRIECLHALHGGSICIIPPLVGHNLDVNPPLRPQFTHKGEGKYSNVCITYLDLGISSYHQSHVTAPKIVSQHKAPAKSTSGYHTLTWWYTLIQNSSTLSNTPHADQKSELLVSMQCPQGNVSLAPDRKGLVTHNTSTWLWLTKSSVTNESRIPNPSNQIWIIILHTLTLL